MSKTISQEQILYNLKLFLDNGSYKNGGVLFFGTAPERFIDTAEVRFLAFEGTNKIQIIDD